MLLRIVGAVCVLIACGGVGFYLAFRYALEERILFQLLEVLNYMECEIMYRLTPLPVLCRQAAFETTGVIHNVFLRLSKELDQQISPDVDCCMNIAVASSTELPAQVRTLLLKLGKQLGKFDLQGQQRGIEIIKQEASRCLKGLYHDKENRIRGYRTLGLCAGAALVILFF